MLGGHRKETRGCSTPYGQPGEGAVRYANRMAQHVARVLASPLKGVYSTHIDSAQQFDRHWHDTYGFGFLEHGAQEWFSGRGIVRGYPGEVIATNPGEVHDGLPLGPPTRRWRIAYVDVDVDPHGIRAGARRDHQSGDQRPASRP